MELIHRQGQTEDLLISALPSCACPHDVVVRHRDGCDGALAFQIQFLCSEKHN
jgi:hypothetical protein